MVSADVGLQVLLVLLDTVAMITYKMSFSDNGLLNPVWHRRPSQDKIYSDMIPMGGSALHVPPSNCCF